MVQYIDKFILVAEIEKKRRIEVTNNDVAYNGALDEIRYFLDTLEVKEVDLEKELDVIIDSLNDDKYEHLSIRQQLSLIAIHFFELGLKAKKE